MFNSKLVIDLGTSFSYVGVKNKGIVCKEPTVVALASDDQSVIAIGQEAKEMIGKVPGTIIAQRPLSEGVITSYRLTQAFFGTLMDRAIGKFRLVRPEVVICVPAGLTSVEERAVVEIAVAAGAGKVYLIPEPLAAAIGSELPVSSSGANMVVNIGGGTSEVAVVSMNGIVTYESKRVGGEAMNEAITAYLKKRYNLAIGEQMVESLKSTLGSAIKVDNTITQEVRGRDVINGLPRTIVLHSNDLLEPIRSVNNQILDSIKEVLEKTPPELTSDIIDRGMVLSGGGSKLQNIDKLFTKSIGVPAFVVEEPELTVVKGLLRVLDNIDIIRKSMKVN